MVYFENLPFMLFIFKCIDRDFIWGTGNEVSNALTSVRAQEGHA